VPYPASLAERVSGFCIGAGKYLIFVLAEIASSNRGGPCTFGTGVELISACDVRIASKNASFSIKEVDIGLAADLGGLQRFPKIVGKGSILGGRGRRRS
jgi:hypothetical protein